jgi:general secretion pathway protein A
MHREALAQLFYGVQERKGFVVLTGEIGTGKTTLVHALIRRLDGRANVALVANATLPFDQLMEYVMEDLGCGSADMGAAQRMIALNRFLIEQERAGRNTVLILDEAQNLERGTLEQVRLLSNFETSTAKLLQVVLVGQPELQATLQRPELRQLRQRIALHCRVRPIEPDETRTYIRTRLRVAGAPDLGLFTDEAVARIARYSQGIPRVINTICDHSLLIAFADQKRRIDRKTAEEAVTYFEAGMAPDIRSRARAGARSWRSRLRVSWAAAGLGVAIASAAVATYATQLSSMASLVAIARDATRAVRDAWLP